MILLGLKKTFFYRDREKRKKASYNPFLAKQTDISPPIAGQTDWLPQPLYFKSSLLCIKDETTIPDSGSPTPQEEPCEQKNKTTASSRNQARS
jgi:hypothetical protein